MNPGKKGFDHWKEGDKAKYRVRENLSTYKREAKFE
jgi:hypothetical protein